MDRMPCERALPVRSLCFLRQATSSRSCLSSVCHHTVEDGQREGDHEVEAEGSGSPPRSPCLATDCGLSLSPLPKEGPQNSSLMSPPK